VTAVLEINDFELTLFRGADAIYRAPAMAIVRDPDIVFGEAALKQFRLYPRQSNQQYLAKLNADPLSEPGRLAANHADLVYLHLKELQQVSSDEVVLAVPGNLSRDQLGVLLGICQEAGLEIRGFVDSAVAAVSTTPCPEALFYLDAHLQHFVITELTAGDEIQRQRAEEVRDCGIANLVTGWMNLISDRFVRETRFDPLHAADSEQQLYSQVYDWLNGAHHHSEFSVVIRSSGGERRVDVPKHELESKAEQRFRPLLDALPARASLALSARSARIPGFVAALRTAGHAVELLNASAVGVGCTQHLSSIVADGGSLRLVTRLPAREVVRAAPPIRTEAPTPTHLLRDHVAVPLTADSGLGIHLREDGPWLTGSGDVVLNGSRLDADTRLRVGDVISDGERQLIAILVAG